MPDVRLVTCAVLPAPDPDMPILAEALTGRGMTVAVDGWRDERVDWSNGTVTVLRSPWDYTERRDEFLAWAERVAGVSALWNPLPLLRWNTHKSYLLELSAAGAPVIPTVLLPQRSAAALDGIADVRGWNIVVVKPAVAVGGDGAGRFEIGDAGGQQHLDALLESGDVLVQQFAPAIEAGEVSIILVDGVATHAVRKLPKPGDFRINEHWGGRNEAMEVPAVLAELGARVVEVLPTQTLYARVDVVPVGGQWVVVEVEATEPSLYLDLAPDAAADRLADAIVARVGITRTR